MVETKQHKILVGKGNVIINQAYAAAAVKLAKQMMIYQQIIVRKVKVQNNK